jgi:hypothetical protein
MRRVMVRHRVFREGIRDRCDEAPVATVLREIGSYRLFGDRAG